MRIVCDSCSAKYQIADEKIAGKLFRVRCKKCSNMIMVDGTQLGGSVAAAAGVGAGDAGQAVWYVVIDGSQTGPLNEEELAAQIAQGLIDSETYAWKEGMADWLRMSDVPALGHLVPANDGFGGEATQVVSSEERPVAGGAASASGAFSAESLTDSSLGTVDSEEPPVPVAPAPVSPGVAERVSGSGLLAAAAADSARSPLAGSAAPRASGSNDEGGGFTAERNESSVLFSLSDLTAPKSQPRGGDAVPRTEGSGLIDIRTLASAQAALAPPTQSDAGSASPGAIAAPAPTMAPMALPPRRQSMVPYIALGALMVVIVLLLGALLLMNRDDPTAVVASSPDTEQAGAETVPAVVPAAEAVAEAPAVAEPVEAVAVVPAADGSGQDVAGGSGDAALAAANTDGPTPEEIAANTAAANEAADPAAEEAAAQARADRQAAQEERRAEPEPARAEPEPAREERREPEAERPAREPQAAPPTPRREENRDSDAVAAALAAIQGSNEEPTPPARENTAAAEPDPEPTTPAAPSTLGRSEVQSAVRRYNSRVARCTEYGEPGTYRVTFSIQRDGSVSGVSPENSDDVSNCVAGVVRAMTFPRFTGDPIPVTYPFRLN